ncbi:MAG: TrkH family potassium uptake protein [Acidaminococcaceae bacterium]
MNVRLVMFILGKVSIVFGLSLLIPVIAAVCFNETQTVEFLLPIIISLLLGGFMSRMKAEYKGHLSLREGLALVGFSWLLVCFLGALPYLFFGFDFISSLFESISGFTTTGATSINDLNAIPNSLILWRALTQWLGGLGIILIFITLVPQVGSSGERLFTAELHGESTERIMPRIKTTVYAISIAYIAATSVLVLILCMLKMTFFEAINYAMTTVSTGGFLMHNEGLGHFNSRYVEVVILLFMFFSGGNYVLYYKAYKEGIKKLWQDTELIAYLSVMLFFTFAITLNLFYSNVYVLSQSIYYSLFQSISTITTTGYFLQNYNEWPEFSRFCILLMMFIGGCAGSTAGGIKVARLLILFKLSWAELKRALHPRMVIDIKLSGNHIAPNMIISISRFFFFYIAIFIFATLFLSLTDKLGMLDSIGIAAASMANIGPAFDMVAPFSTYADVSAATKLISSVLMLLGRLEIFSLLIFLNPEFWRGTKNW